MSFEFDPYIILGVAEDATPGELRNAHNRAAKRLHPDINRNPGAMVQLQEINAAYALLADPDQRRAYDEAHAQQPRDLLDFTLRVTPSKRTVTQLSEPQVLYLLAELLADPRAKRQFDQHEARLNLVLVLDQSNSMNGVSLEKVQVAAHQIIDHLNEDDIIAVVGFNDRAEVIIPATTVHDKPALKARISMMSARGGTEIFQGLTAGVGQVRQFLGPRLVNHLVLLTDGNTFGDQERSLKLARAVKSQGIVISAMGLGHEWNDEFLDDLASTTGGTCKYITSPDAVVRFLNDHVRHLSSAFAEQVHLSVAPDPDITLESAFKLAPSPQPLPVEEGTIPLGSLHNSRPITVLFQFELPANLDLSFRTIARIVVGGNILANESQPYQAISDLSIEITTEPEDEAPPTVILDALGKLTLYRMQERAQEALARGDVREATQRLERLATRLLQIGQPELADQAKSEAQRVAMTNQLSDKGRKTLKFQTRYLLLEPVIED